MSRRLALAAPLALTALALSGPPACAQVLGVPAAAAQEQQVFVVNDAVFNRLVFGNQQPTAVRDRLKRILTLKIAYVDRLCGISQAQREILELAGKGDIKRWFDVIEDHRQGAVRQYDQEEYVKVMQQLQTLQRGVGDDAFGDGSLFSKVLRTTLDRDQAARYAAAEQDKQRSRYLTRIEQYVALLDNTLGLSAEQRRKLVSLLLGHTRPPKQYGPYDLMVVQHQMLRLSEAQLRPIFDEAQWRGLSRRVEESKAIEPILTRGDFLPDDAASRSLP
jgi:hypothetical protein